MTDQQALSPEQLVQAAKAGDVDAMYQVASILGAEGHKEQSVTWLKKAAGNGHGDARFTLANFYLKGINLERNVAQAITILEAGVKSWHMPSVQLYTALVAQGAGTERSWTKAVDLLLLSAVRGHSPAMVELAFLLILAQAQTDLATELMRAAACRKNLHAGLYIASTLSEDSEKDDHDIAAYWVGRALELGHPNAEKYKTLAGAVKEPTMDQAPLPAFDPDIVKTSLHKLTVWTPKDAKTIMDRPNVKKIEAAIPLSICAYIKALSAPRLQAATEYDMDSGEWVAHSQCKGFVASYWQEDHNMVTFAVADRLAKAAGADHQFAEQFNVLAFEEEGQYLPRIDFVDPDLPGSSENLTRAGQCSHTVELILQTADEGGEPIYGPTADSIDTADGDILILRNLLSDQEPDDQAMSAILPVKKGQKWSALRLIREKKQDF
ncbi:hypothetical protein QGN29_07290 [Temperatibacter marinus]|uniref:Sel1 repeat family protein n=1 Tax=Temperatibacter marinus TaxID=1456591 RepID=A0AA52EAW1_9PROT|nr:hypothetical protein [Temperatibacter marinus]WND01365.1 hypothetical protein QGN29_07290 [Temperatibacter marinus]